MRVGSGEMGAPRRAVQGYVILEPVGVVSARFTVEEGQLLVCGDSIRHRDSVYEKTCRLLKPGDEVEVRAKLLSADDLFYAPPPLYIIPADPLNPYTPIDLFLVIDTKPTMHVEGIPHPYTRVISTTKRVVVDARTAPQLIAYQGHRRNYYYSSMTVFFTAPVSGPNWVIDEAKHCEANGKPWSYCVVYVAKRYASTLPVELAKTGVPRVNELRGPQRIGFKIRLVEPLALLYRVDPTRFIEYARTEKKVVEELVTILRLAESTLLLVTDSEIVNRVCFSDVGEDFEAEYCMNTTASHYFVKTIRLTRSLPLA